MSLLRSYFGILVWVLVSILATGVITYSDYKASKGKEHVDMLRELSRSRSIIEESVHRYFTLIKALEAFVHANKDLYTQGGEGRAEFSQRFYHFSEALEKNSASVISLQLAPMGVVTYVTKMEKNAKAIGHDLLKDDNRRDQVIRTIINKTTVVAGPLTLIQGGNAIIARKAIFTEPGTYKPEDVFSNNRASIDATWPSKIPNDFWGFATMLIDTDRLFKEFGLHELPSEYRFALRGKHGLGDNGDIFWGDENIFMHDNYTTEIILPGGSWVMAIKKAAPPIPFRGIFIILTGLLITAFGIYGFYSRQKKIEAEAEAKTHNRFLATMSHEIRTPMNGIIGVAEVMRNTDLTPNQESQLDKILNSSKLLLRLVNDILDFSKIDTGNLTLENKPYNPKKVLLSAEHAIEAEADSKGITIENHIAPDFPEAVEGDEVRLQQVLVNLLSNAVKFTENGSIKITASLIERHNANYLRFRIQDSGIGMSEDDLKRIFNPFTQADQSITRKFGGTGLGLVICDKIVSLMNGKITVQSKQGVGSSFQVSIPYHESSHSIEEKSQPQHTSQATDAKTRHDLNILVVDDQVVNIEVAAMILQQLGYNCQKASSGQEALDLAQRESFDIIYMDRQMPEMDGLETMNAIRKITNSATHPWVVALTASAREDEKEEYLAAGANDFMSKPVDIESFKTSIQKYVAYVNGLDQQH